METRTIRPNGGRSRKRPRWSYRCMVPARRVKSLRKQPELGALIRGQALGLAGVDRGLGDPVAQRLLRAAQITGDPGDRLAAIAHQPHRLSPELRRIGRPCSSHRGLPSGGRAPNRQVSTKPRQLQSAPSMRSRPTGASGTQATNAPVTFAHRCGTTTAGDPTAPSGTGRPSAVFSKTVGTTPRGGRRRASTRRHPVNERCRAGEGVWAVGDVTGVMPLVHVGKQRRRSRARGRRRAPSD